MELFDTSQYRSRSRLGFSDIDVDCDDTVADDVDMRQTRIKPHGAHFAPQNGQDGQDTPQTRIKPHGAHFAPQNGQSGQENGQDGRQTRIKPHGAHFAPHGKKEPTGNRHPLTETEFADLADLFEGLSADDFSRLLSITIALAGAKKIPIPKMGKGWLKRDTRKSGTYLYLRWREDRRCKSQYLRKIV